MVARPAPAFSKLSVTVRLSAMNGQASGLKRPREQSLAVTSEWTSAVINPVEGPGLDTAHRERQMRMLVYLNWA